MSTQPRRTRLRLYVSALLTALSIALGVAGSFVPWGPEDGFHGYGIPIPSMCWDKASYYYDHVTEDSDYLIDFPNPLAVIENPALVFVATMALWGVVESALFVVRRLRRATWGP